MSAFERDNLTLRSGREYTRFSRRDPFAWLAGIVIVVAIIGGFAYESGNPVSRAPSMQTETAPTVIPAPPMNPVPSHTTP